MQPALHRRHRRAQRGGDVGAAEALDVAQEQHGASVFVELRERRFERFPQLRLQDRELGARCLRGDCRDLIERIVAPWLARATTLAMTARVQDHPQKPAGDGPIAAIGPSAAPRMQEPILQRVLRLASGATNAMSQSIQNRLVTRDQGIEGRGVTSRARPKQIFVGTGHAPLLPRFAGR